MLKTNLAVLLAERDLRITKVAEDTGISRTTLTSLASNSSQGIQFDTLNRLCIYLQVTPERFFSFIPYEVNLHLEKSNSDKDTFWGYFTIKEKNKEINCFSLIRVNIIVDNSFSGVAIYGIDIHVEPPPQDMYIELKDMYVGGKENKLLTKYLSDIPITFKREVDRMVIDKVLMYYKDDHLPERETLEINVFWPTA